MNEDYVVIAGRRNGKTRVIVDLLVKEKMAEKFEKIEDRIKWEANGQDGAFIKAYKVFDIIDKEIAELKGENNG